MLSTVKIDMPVPSILNDQGMSHQEEARMKDKNARNNFSEQDDLSHAVRTPLHVLGGYVASLEKLSQGFNPLKMSDQDVRINLFRRSARLGRYLSTIQAQAELLVGGNYVEFFRQRSSSEKSDSSDELSISVFREALASLTTHINHLEAAQEKLKTLVLHFEKLSADEFKNQFDEIAMEIKTIAVQIKKEMDNLNGTIPSAVNAPLSVMKKEKNFKPLRVLIVDDIAANQRILRRMLGKQHCCEFANNGKEAVEKYSENNFDIIFMDIQMPVMDGLEATREIRQQELATNKRRTPIIASTAIDSSALEKGITVAAGMDGYIMKPYDEKRVREIIHLHTTEKGEKVCQESERDERPFMPIFPRRKIVRNGIFARSASVPGTANSRMVSPGSDPGPSCFDVNAEKNPELASSASRWGASPDGHGLLAKFHLLRHENSNDLVPAFFAGSEVTPR
jgi:CheY-like chemotaxis protein